MTPISMQVPSLVGCTSRSAGRVLVFKKPKYTVLKETREKISTLSFSSKLTAFSDSLT